MLDEPRPRRPGIQDDAPTPARRDAIPREWRDRLLSDQDRYVLRDNPSVAVSRASASELATRHNNPEIARLLVATADERGWSSVSVHGSDVFRREAWVEATARGIQVSGYRARELDVQEAGLRARQFDDRNRIQADQKAVRNLDPELLAARNPAQANHAVAIAATHRYLDSGKADPTARRLVEAAMRENLSARSPDQVRDIDMRAPRGTVKDFGPAPYRFERDADLNYYVRLERNGQERIVWGKGLEQAIRDADVQRGDTVTFRRDGRVMVQVPANVRDPKTGTRQRTMIDTERQQWKVDQIERASSSIGRAPSPAPNPDRER